MAGPGDLSGDQLRYFGAIQAATRVYANTAEIWMAVKGQAEATGESLPAGMFTAVNVMRGLAAGLRSAAQTFEGATSSDPITAAMIGTQPYANLSGPDVIPGYDVRFQVSMTYGDGTTQDEWYVRRYSGGLPDTVGDLYGELADFADGLATGYGTSAGPISNVEIGAI